MQRESSDVSHAEAGQALDRILDFISTELDTGQQIENERARRLLETLIDVWLKDRNGRRKQHQLVHALGLQPVNEESTLTVRQTAEKIRNYLLVEYYRARPLDPIVVDLPKVRDKQGYRLLIQKNTRPLSAEGRGLLLLNYRAKQAAWFEKTICTSKDVLFVSVGSQLAIYEIELLLKAGRVAAKHFRVLTWLPASEEVAQAFAEHLDEHPASFMEKARTAWNEWKRLERLYDAFEVYAYATFPSMQAICDADTSVQIELFPFNRAATHEGFHAAGTLSKRPALLIDAAKDAEAYQLFKGAFEDLWTEAKQKAPAADVHPRWQRTPALPVA